MDVLYGDQNAFHILNFDLMSQFWEPKEGDIYLSEAAMNSMQQTLDDAKEDGYCGVFRNIQKGSATNEPSSVQLVYYIMEVNEGKNFEYVRTMLLKVSGDEEEALKSIRNFNNQKPSLENLYINTFNRHNENLYGTEKSNLKLVEAFGFIVLLLTVLSLLAISTFYARFAWRFQRLRGVEYCLARRSLLLTRIFRGFQRRRTHSFP